MKIYFQIAVILIVLTTQLGFTQSTTRHTPALQFWLGSSVIVPNQDFVSGSEMSPGVTFGANYSLSRHLALQIRYSYAYLNSRFPADDGFLYFYEGTFATYVRKVPDKSLHRLILSCQLSTPLKVTGNRSTVFVRGGTGLSFMPFSEETFIYNPGYIIGQLPYTITVASGSVNPMATLSFGTGVSTSFGQSLHLDFEMGFDYVHSQAPLARGPAFSFGDIPTEQLSTATAIREEMDSIPV